MKNLLKKFLKSLGYEVRKIEAVSYDTGILSNLNNFKVVDLEKLSLVNSKIDGMISDYQGKVIFLLCFFQNLKGDVLEIGSFKGKSTSFLFRAVNESKNGNLIVIDNFQGIKGKEKLYGEFRNEFNHNMEKIGALKKIKIFDGDSKKLIHNIKDNSLRYIYIDGDHSYEGIKSDLVNSLEKIKVNGIIVLDDYFDGFPELIKSVNEILKTKPNFKLLCFSHNLIIQKIK